MPRCTDLDANQLVRGRNAAPWPGARGRARSERSNRRPGARILCKDLKALAKGVILIPKEPERRMISGAVYHRLIGRVSFAAAAAAGLSVLALMCALVGWRLPAVALSAGALAAAIQGWRAAQRLRETGAAVDSTVPADPIPSADKTDQDVAQFTPLLEALPDPALLVDREGRVLASNRAARKALQFEAAGLRLSAIIRHPELLDAAAAAAQHGSVRTVDYEARGGVEEHFRCYVASVALGDKTAALLVFHDQTAQMTTERSRAEFLANASHELRTPLASLSLIVETLNGPARDDPKARDKFLNMIQGQVDRMSRLVNDLLSLSRIELNEHVPPSESADLAAVAQEAADALSPVASVQGVLLRLALPQEPALVLGDRFQLVQVAQNLIANAIRYSPAGTQIHVTVGVAANREQALERCNRLWPDAGRVSLLTPPPSQRPFAYLSVQDQGVGVPRRHLPRLGERFFRVERAEGAEQSGTGLGLAIVKHIVNRHRGGLTVESVPGKGANFAVCFEQA